MPASNNLISFLLQDFFQTVLPGVSGFIVRRDMELGVPPKPRVGSNAKVVTGMRRSGKTFRIYQEILDLMNAGVPPERICYFNFDDDRVRPDNATLVARVLEAFYTLHPQARSQGAFVFFDEVQDIEGWDIVARRLLDTEKVSMYVTGSSSRLLSDDIATEFRGRSVAYELAPYSFREFLRNRNEEPSSSEVAGNKETASLLRHELLDYLKCGGFPAVQALSDFERIQTLQTYAQLVVARDVVERQGFANAAYARTLARAAVTSSARDFSISRMDAKGRQGGYTPGRAAISNLVDAFEDAHLVYQVYDFTYSAQKSRLGGLKLYAQDPGLYSAMMPAADDARTFALETAVYLELRRRRASGRLGDIAMLKLKSGKEVDFVEGDALLDTATRLVQVSFSIESEKTLAREVSALREAMKRFGVHESWVVTFDEEQRLSFPEGAVHVVPAWRWLLDES